jgi:hypothetical protein
MLFSPVGFAAFLAIDAARSEPPMPFPEPRLCLRVLGCSQGFDDGVGKKSNADFFHRKSDRFMQRVLLLSNDD